MQTGYISFCDKTAFNIKSDKVKKKILQNINNISNITITLFYYIFFYVFVNI